MAHTVKEKFSKKTENNVPKCTFFDDKAGCGEPVGIQPKPKGVECQDKRQEECQDEGQSKVPPEPDTSKNEEPKELTAEEKAKEAILWLPRNSVSCPITTCGSFVTGTMALSHFISYHCGVLKTQIIAVMNDRRTPLSVNTAGLVRGENVCLGVLVYGGVDKNKTSLPVMRDICLRNNSLPREHSRFHSHMPIVVMACKANYKAFLTQEEIEEEEAIADPKESIPDVLSIWLLTVPATKTMHCTVTCFDSRLRYSKSKIMQLRPLNVTQDIDEILSEDKADHLILHSSDVKKLTSNGTKRMELEVTILEYPVTQD